MPLGFGQFCHSARLQNVVRYGFFEKGHGFLVPQKKNLMIPVFRSDSKRGDILNGERDVRLVIPTRLSLLLGLVVRQDALPIPVCIRLVEAPNFSNRIVHDDSLPSKRGVGCFTPRIEAAKKKLEDVGFFLTNRTNGVMLFIYNEVGFI